MTGAVWFLSTILAVAGIASGTTCIDDDLADSIKLLREQVNALLDHRQEDYNALEGSLKRAIEKNTEVFVLRNEIVQLRKEVNSLRGGNGNGNANGYGNGSGNGNEAKNERLRVRWLGSAVTELQGEVAEVLRARNASEELAERARMRSELVLLKGDVAEVGRGIRSLGGRIAKMEAALGVIRVDITAVKERSSLLSRTCADITSQLSGIQIEVKSLKCESSSSSPSHAERLREEAQSKKGRNTVAMEHVHRRTTKRHGYSRRSETYRLRVEDRLKGLERKLYLVSQKGASLEKRLVYDNQEFLGKRVRTLESLQAEISRRVRNVSDDMSQLRKSGDFLVSRFLNSVRVLEEAIEANRSEARRQLSQLEVNAARKAAELSLTREELGNLRRTVQAVGVSASNLQERSDRQQEAIDRLNVSFSSLAGNTPRTALQVDLEQADVLPDQCDGEGVQRPDGSRVIAADRGVPRLLSCRDGWMVISRRIDGSLDFDRTWSDYSAGFGSPLNEFWIGNELLHRITRDNCTSLRIDLLDIYGERWRAEYEEFYVEPERTGYRLHVAGYTGNATDGLSYQNGMAFSAKDRDMDISKADCAGNYHGGWWFSHCQHANLNGKYSLGLTWFRSDTNGWMPVASSEMSLKKKENCKRRLSR